MLAATTTDGWKLGIGDPTVMGWFTVLVYFLSSFLCWKSAKASLPAWKTTGNAGPVFFWLSFFILLLLLGINKQLDLQTWFTDLGRNVAKAHGWYERRQVVQTVFIAIFAMIGLAFILLFVRLTRGSIRDCRMALLGGIFLICFVLIRAASFHHVDQLLGMHLARVKLNWILELGGIFCIAWNACQFLTRRRSHDVADHCGAKHAQRV